MSLPRWRQITSSRTSRMSSAWPIAWRTASTVAASIRWPPPTSSTSSSTTARASATSGSSPSIVSWFPRRRIVAGSRRRSASRIPSPMPASSVATSFGTETTSRNGLSVGRGAGLRRLRELLACDLADGGAVRAARDLRHDVGHDPAEVTEARGAHLGDHVVDDLLELLLGERLGHELLEHLALVVLVLGLLLAPAGAKGVGCLDALLALALQHLELLVVVQRPLQVLLGLTQLGEDQAQRVAPVP